MRTKPSSTSQPPKTNRLLAALPEKNYLALLPLLEPVVLPLGMAVYESNAKQGYVYFPTSSIVSLLYVLENGASAEIAVTGPEGLVGIALFMGGETTPSRAVVQSAGHGYRLKAAVLKAEFERGGPLQHLLLRFTQALITQMTQTAVCNRHHAVDQQLLAAGGECFAARFEPLRGGCDRLDGLVQRSVHARRGFVQHSVHGVFLGGHPRSVGACPGALYPLGCIADYSSLCTLAYRRDTMNRHGFTQGQPAAGGASRLDL